MRCRASSEREKLKAESEGLKGLKRADMLLHPTTRGANLDFRDGLCIPGGTDDATWVSRRRRTPTPGVRASAGSSSLQGSRAQARATPFRLSRTQGTSA